MPSQDEVQIALAASIEGDLRVRSYVRAVVTGQVRRDSARFRQLVVERNAAFADYLQAFMRRSRDRAPAAPFRPSMRIGGQRTAGNWSSRGPLFDQRPKDS